MAECEKLDEAAVPFYSYVMFMYSVDSLMALLKLAILTSLVKPLLLYWNIHEYVGETFARSYHSAQDCYVKSILKYLHFNLGQTENRRIYSFSGGVIPRDCKTKVSN